MTMTQMLFLLILLALLIAAAAGAALLYRLILIIEDLCGRLVLMEDKEMQLDAAAQPRPPNERKTQAHADEYEHMSPLVRRQALRLDRHRGESRR